MKKTLTDIGADSYGNHICRDAGGKPWMHPDYCVPKEVCQERGDRLYSSCGNTLDGEPDCPMQEGIECEFINARETEAAK